ncbi:MAG TPA: PilZ domain-containing protein [Candidatus Avamphibacillus sp.]|nr:PilZ domain-containing protein [Candidatus Avamphibacillus sp.]
MRYKRKSYFRYTFEEPVPALFQIKRIDDTPIETSQGEAKLVDISPEGARLDSELNIPETDYKTIELAISFNLNGQDLEFNGVIVRHKERITTNEYGIEFLVDKEEKELLIKQLKVHSKKLHDIPE